MPFLDTYFGSPDFKKNWWELTANDYTKGKNSGFNVGNMFQEQDGRFYGAPQHVNNMLSVVNPQMMNNPINSNPTGGNKFANVMNPTNPVNPINPANSTNFMSTVNPVNNPTGQINTAPAVMPQISSPIASQVPNMSNPTNMNNPQVEQNKKNLSNSFLRNLYGKL